MKYLRGALSLSRFIGDFNQTVLEKGELLSVEPNHMIVYAGDGSNSEYKMDSFTDEFVKTKLGQNKSTACIITDVVSANIHGKDMTYILYKGYHCDVDKGMVFYQFIEEKSWKPAGELQFSNMEENIFYSVTPVNGEESSCNALEKDQKIENGKSIVFLIGHMNEERLVYDIQRLIVDTIHNVSKHPKLLFEFTIHISRFGGEPSSKLQADIRALDHYTRNTVCPAFPNTAFEFSFEEVEE